MIILALAMTILSPEDLGYQSTVTYEYKPAFSYTEPVQRQHVDTLFGGDDYREYKNPSSYNEYYEEEGEAN